MNTTANDQRYARMLELIKRDMPRLVNGFTGMQQQATADGALDSKTKSLAALAIAVLRGVDDNITQRITAALTSGATEAEILEAIGMAIMLGGEPVSHSANRAYAILEALQRA